MVEDNDPECRSRNYQTLSLELDAGSGIRTLLERHLSHLERRRAPIRRVVTRGSGTFARRVIPCRVRQRALRR